MATKTDFPASYYGNVDGKNPVMRAFKKEINSFSALMKRLTSSPILENTAYAKGIQNVVEIWKKYKPRLPLDVYHQHVLQTADLLLGLKLYHLAMWQGYNVYLTDFLLVHVEEATDMELCRERLFPTGFHTDQATLTMKVRALEGCVQCVFAQEGTVGGLTQGGLRRLLHTLRLCRLTMQACQPHEHLSWHLYNGSLCVYEVCRYLMKANYSAQALQFLVWASICLELSVTLATTEFLPWKTTLYCAACQCYYDCNAPAKAERFARRALEKVNELAKLEEHNEGSLNADAKKTYREACIKLSVMVFKRTAFERRSSAGDHLLPSRADSPQGPWRQSPAGRLLADLFGGCDAASFLALLEALSDGRPRLGTCAQPGEPRAAQLELLSAGTSLLSGTGGRKDVDCEAWPAYFSALTTESSQLELAVSGENALCLAAALRFLELLFHYGRRRLFKALARHMAQALQSMEGPFFRKAEKELTLLEGLVCLQSAQKARPKEELTANEVFEGKEFEQVVSLVAVLHQCVCSSAQDVCPDRDLVLAAVLSLWARLKAHFQNTELQPLQSKNSPDPQKLLWCLWALHEAASACDLASADCLAAGELTLRLALLLEHTAHPSPPPRDPPHEGEEHLDRFALPILKRPRGELFNMMCEVLEGGLDSLGRGWDSLQEQTGLIIQPRPKEGQGSTKEEAERKTSCEDRPGLLSLMALDLNLELLNAHHRASLRRLQCPPEGASEAELLKRVKKNKVSKALFLAQKALVVSSDTQPNRTGQTKGLLEEAVVLIERAGAEETWLHKLRSTQPSTGHDGQRDDEPPPAPLLRSSTNRSLTFVPAPYHSSQKVSWYQICGRATSSLDQKVRLGDHGLQGTGQWVPVVGGHCELTVEGLQHNQSYMFAVAAYGSQGALLGSAIGQTTRPMLASIPLPTLSAWGLLAQAGWEIGHFAVAKRACAALWNHFTQADGPGPSLENHGNTQTHLSLARLNVERLERSSPLLLQWFLTSVFIETDINVQQGALFCDSISERGPHIWGQDARLAECARLLLAVEAGLRWGGSCYALQAVVGCYGLLVPLIYHQVVWEPMVQVLVRCLEVLEENSALFKERRSPETSEALLHMVACITHYLSRALGVLERPEASRVMGRGQRLMQGVYQAQVTLGRPAVRRRLSRRVPPAGLDEVGPELRTLGSLHPTPPDPLKTSRKAGPNPTQHGAAGQPLSAEGHLGSAYHEVMKLKRKGNFLESAAVLLQRVMARDAPDLVIQWGADIFHCVHRNDKSLGPATGGVQKRGLGNTTSQNLVQVKAALQEPVGQRERKALEAFLGRLSQVVQRGRQQVQRRGVLGEQRVWRAQLNLLMAQAYLALLHRQTAPLHQRYSRFHPWAFSLAHSGVLVASGSALTHPSPFGNHRDDLASTSSMDTDSDEMVSMGGSKDWDERPPSGAGQRPCPPDRPGTPDPTALPSPVSTPRRDPNQTLRSSLRHAALHLRRAMVLAHRGGQWACLQHACRTLWEQSSSLAARVARDPDPRPPAAAAAPPCPLTLGLLNTAFTPLLVLASDLLVDMMDRLGLWEDWEGDATQENPESSLSGRVDLSWIQTLVLDTLGRLHAQAKWESLAHYALLFNCYTRGRHTLQVSPLLVHAQRRLLERVSEFGGPPVPQPHHARTPSTPVTWKNYAGYQPRSGWSSASLPGSDRQQPPTPCNYEDLKAQEVHRAMGLVRVPLDLEDTLAAYRLALQNLPRSLHLLQHSRTLLHLLLAGANLTAGVRQGGDDDDGGGGGLGGAQVEICPAVTAGPDPEPRDLTRQDFRTPCHLYSLPLGPQHTHTAIAAYCASIKLLESSELKVHALHDLGNLQMYAGQTRAARVSWSTAVDRALRSAGVLDTWDGAHWAGGAGAQQDTLRLAGVWGCLQAAVITAKTAQFMLTSDIHQRTMCCLLAAHLFKCVLCSSQPHPQRDLLYASHVIGEELLPGVDLFYDPIRVHPPTTVASLHFLCHWLYSARHYVTLLPMLALYRYFTRSRCRDVHRTVEGTLLKVRALTELSMFGQAVKEAMELSHGQGVTLPHGADISQDSQLQPSRRFHDNKPILENLQAVEDLLNCRLSQEVRGWYGPVLCQRLRLARVQLVLALCQTLPGLPVPGRRREENTGDSVGSEGDQGTLETENSSQGDKEPGRLSLAGSGREKPSPGTVKWVMLDWVHRVLELSGGPTPGCGAAEYCGSTQELEIAIETQLLLSNMHLQLGRAALSADMAANSLELLQTSPSFRGDAPGPSHLSARVSEGPLPAVPCPADCPREVQASERLGAPLWLSGRLALHRALAAHLPGTSVHPGPDISEQTARVLKEGLQECVSWGDPDTRALMLLQAAAAHTDGGPYRGQSGADPTAMLSEAVSLLSDRTCLSAASSLALALATVQLSALRGTASTMLLELGQRLLQQQLTAFGESVEMKRGGGAQGLNNIYLPQGPLLARTTMHIGHILALRAAETSANPAPEVSSAASTPDTQGAPAGPPHRMAGVQSWREAREVLGSALGLSRCCAPRDTQLEGRLLYCRGVAERSLSFYGQVQPEEVARTLLDCIQTTMTHGHNLPVLRQCYLEVAFLFLQDMPPTTPRISTPASGSYWRNLLARLKRRLTAAEEHLLPFWVCLRAAHTVTSSMRGARQLAGSGAAEEREGGGGGALSRQELNALPDFAKSDLLQHCHVGTHYSSKEDRSTDTQLTWTHLARYFTHLLNLQHAAQAGAALWAGDASIAARLSQLHSFYCDHSGPYRETCCLPQPDPSHILLRAPPTQPGRVLRAPVVQQEEEVYKWSISPRPQLCVQWYQPYLPPGPGTQDTVILLYGYNSHPISATGGSANGLLGLQCGHRVINTDSVRALHAELSEVSALADIGLSGATGSQSAWSPPSQGPAPADDKTTAVVRDRTLACCGSIQELLQGGSRPLTQVPFEVSLDNLRGLERCFNPRGGAVLPSSTLTEWILAALINS